MKGKNSNLIPCNFIKYLWVLIFFFKHPFPQFIMKYQQQTEWTEDIQINVVWKTSSLLYTEHPNRKILSHSIICRFAKIWMNTFEEIILYAGKYRALLFFHLPTANVLKMSSTISRKRLHFNSLKSLLKATDYKLKLPHYVRCHLYTGNL